MQCQLTTNTDHSQRRLKAYVINPKVIFLKTKDYIKQCKHFKQNGWELQTPIWAKYIEPKWVRACQLSTVHQLCPSWHKNCARRGACCSVQTHIEHIWINSLFCPSFFLSFIPWCIASGLSFFHSFCNLIMCCLLSSCLAFFLSLSLSFFLSFFSFVLSFFLYFFPSNILSFFRSGLFGVFVFSNFQLVARLLFWAV